jgi:hypothetical protein
VYLGLCMYVYVGILRHFGFGFEGFGGFGGCDVMEGFSVVR